MHNHNEGRILIVRPKEVKGAIICLVSGYGTTSAEMITRANWLDLSWYLLGMPTLVAAWLLVLMIYRGRIWARLVFAIMTAAWLPWMATSSIMAGTKPVIDSPITFCTQLFLLAAAVTLLFSQHANAWFREVNRLASKH